MADSKLSNSTGSLNVKHDSPINKSNDNINKNKNSDNGHKAGSNVKKRKINHLSNTQQSSNYNANFNGQQHTRLTGSPAWDLPPQNASSQTFTGRCRLFVANLPSNVTEESLRKLFAEFGKMSDIYIGKGNQFAFIKMDTRSNAENAKNALDGKSFEGRTLRVRLAAHAAAIKVTNLPPCVSNELLHLAFSTFGPVERAIVVADDRGRSLNEGIVEFARKSSAQAAIKKCQNECLLLSSTPIPVVVTSLESRDEEEGVPEKNVLYTAEYRKEREVGPRFAEMGTIEYEIAKKWLHLAQIEAQRRESFESEMKDMHENFKNQMEYFQLEESTKKLREQLIEMENQSKKLDAERGARFDYERQREEQRRQHENMLRAQEEQLIGPQGNQNDMNNLRRQESELRQQANALQQLLDRQESALRQMNVDSNLGHQHMDSNMYGQSGMGGHNPGPMMPPGQMAPPPPGSNPMTMPYGAPNNSPMHQQHPQMVPHPHQMQTPMHRPQMVSYNGVPGPNMPPQSFNSSPVPRVQSNMNHPSNNYGKRNRRY